MTTEQTGCLRDLYRDWYTFVAQKLWHDKSKIRCSPSPTTKLYILSHICPKIPFIEHGILIHRYEYRYHFMITIKSDQISPILHTIFNNTRFVPIISLFQSTKTHTITSKSFYPKSYIRSLSFSLTRKNPLINIHKHPP